VVRGQSLRALPNLFLIAFIFLQIPYY
jgi:hypothetical protein